MKLNTQFNKESIKNLYEDNKEYSLPMLCIVISFLLFFIFIVPQALSFPSKKQEADVENVKLNKIKETEKILQNADKNLIESQLKIASKALPSNKSFEEILNAISNASALSAVLIENYKYDNKLSSTSGSEPEKIKFSSLLFEVSIIGTTKDATSFIKELYRTYPIADVTSIVTSGETTSIEILFYYKAFSSVSLSDRTELKSISEEEKRAFNEISKWNDANIDIDNIINPLITASESAEVNPSPF